MQRDIVNVLQIMLVGVVLAIITFAYLHALEVLGI